MNARMIIIVDRPMYELMLLDLGPEDRKGGDMSEWPTDLMHQESPVYAAQKETK